MPNFSPIQLTLYGEDNEIKATYDQRAVSPRVIEKARLIVEIFGHRFSIKDVKQGVESSEMLTVIRTVRTRGGVPLKPSAFQRMLQRLTRHGGKHG